MKMPRQLFDMNVFNKADAFAGQAKTFTRPKIAMKTESWRGAGMLAEVQLDMGLEALEAESEFGGIMPELDREFGLAQLDASQLRFAGAYRNDETGGYDNVQIIIRGRHTERDTGGDSIGEKSSAKYKHACVYYKETLNGRTLFEIDVLAGKYIVDGVDRWAAARSITA